MTAHRLVNSSRKVVGCLDLFQRSAVVPSDFNSYLAALSAHWLAFMSTGPFLADRLVTWLWPRGRGWLDTFSHRQKLYLFLIVAGIFWAGYSTWHDEHERRISVEQTIAPSPYHWQFLSAEEQASLRATIRDIPPQPIAIFCNEADCDDLAKSFREVFRNLNWEVACCTFGFGGFDPGLRLWAKTSELKAIAEKIEAASKGRLKVDFTDKPTYDPAKYPLQLFIGAKT
jgi:hypothetical protein